MTFLRPRRAAQRAAYDTYAEYAYALCMYAILHHVGHGGRPSVVVWRPPVWVVYVLNRIARYHAPSDTD